MVRSVALAAVMLWAALLGGCTVNLRLYVRNGYPFAISVTQPYRDLNNKAQHENYGVVPAGQLKRMPQGLSRYGSAHLEVRSPSGQIVRQVWISKGQFDQMYMASKADAAAVYLNVGPGQVSVVGQDDPSLIAANKRNQITAWVILVTGGTVFVLWLVLLRRNQMRAWRAAYAPHEPPSDR